MDKNKKKRIILIAALACLVLILAAVSIWFGVKKASKTEPAGTSTEQTKDKNSLSNNYQESDKLTTDETVSELAITSDMILSNAMFVKNNDMEQPGEITKSDNGVKLTIPSNYSGLKCLFVRGIELPTAGVDTMSVRIRTLGSNGFTRFRLYFCSTPSEKMDSNKVIDTVDGDDAIYPDLVSVTKLDADGWQTVTIKIGELPYWKHTTSITGFNFAFLDKDDVQEVSDIRFTVGGVTYTDAKVNYTSGDFPASVLYKDAMAVKNNNQEQTGTIELTDTGARFTMTGTNGAAYNGLKSIYVNDIALNTALYDTMTIRIRSLGSNGFTRFRLYLNANANEKMDKNMLLDTGGDTPYKANLLSITSPDAQGWQTITIKVGELDFWKNNDVITAFNFGYISKDATQEVYEIRFTKGAITYPDSPAPVVEYTSGNFPASVLYSDAVAIMNNNTSVTGTAKLKSTGVAYTMVREDSGASYSGLKSIYVNGISLDSSAYDTMTVRIRTLGTNGFTRFRLYLNSTEYDKPDTNKLLDTGSPTINENLLSITDPDENGWQIVTIKVGDLDFWKNNSVITGFNFGYLCTDDVQEISQIIFSKGTPELDLSGSEEEDNTGDDENTDDDNTSTGYSVGSFPASVLYELGTPVYNNDKTKTDDISEAMAESGDAVTYTSTESNALKSVYVENLALDPDMFSKMTIRLRSLDGGSFGLYRLYLSTEKGESLSTNAGKVVDSNSASYYKDLVSTSTQTIDGVEWTIVTIDLSGVSQWTGAQVINAFNFGYTCHPGTQQQIAEIQFAANVGDDSSDDSSSEDVQANIENGQFPAATLLAAGKPIYDNDASDTSSQEALNTAKDSVVYTFGTGLAEKSICVEDLTWNPADFVDMKVRLKSDTDFERFRLYLNDGLYGTAVVDVRVDGTDKIGKSNVNADLVTITEDSDGWITVTINVKDLAAWKNASTITAFRFSYVNEGSEQQVSEIQFTKASSDDSGDDSSDDNTDNTVQPYTLEGDTLYNSSNAYYNNTTVYSKSSQTTGVRYDFTGKKSASALKSVYLNNISIDTTKYDTMTVRIRSLDGSDFTRFRLYLNSDASEKIDKNKLIDTGGNPTVNASLLTASAADSDGWITVTIKVGELDYWKNATTIVGVNFGYLNADDIQEISSITFSKSTTSE